MLFDRLRDTDDDTVLYHYCTPDAFIEIVKNKTIRFSDINLLNDEQEGRYGYDVFIEAANSMLSGNKPDLIDGFDVEFVDLVDGAWHNMGFRLTSFLSCFSVDGDSLGQWRAYAADAEGFAIGFRASRIRALPVQLLDVLYDRENQLSEMKIALAALYLELKEAGLSPEEFGTKVNLIAASSAAFKNTAWHEEKEVRAQHVVDVTIQEDCMFLNDAGGTTDEGDVGGQSIQFHSRRGTLTPFIDMPFVVTDNVQPIAEVVLGPKCKNAAGNVLLALGNYGFKNVAIKKAGAAYR
mgnify:CR=1 FL=1